MSFRPSKTHDQRRSLSLSLSDPVMNIRARRFSARCLCVLCSLVLDFSLRCRRARRRSVCNQ